MVTQNLVDAVLNWLNEDDREDAISQAKDAGSHGADAEWPGFIYYSDTCRFTKENREAIAELVRDFADDLGQGVIEFVRSFRCVENDTSDKAIASALWGPGSTDSSTNYNHDIEMTENALAWFALEEVGRYLADREE